MSIERQWAALYERGVCPREVAVAVTYTYGESDVPPSGVSEKMRAIAGQAGLRIETLPEYRARQEGQR